MSNIRTLAIAALSALSASTCSAQDAGDPPQPSKAEAEQLIQDGDRAADQADYKAALEHYTQAYHAKVSEVRGQKFSKRVLPSLMTREELGKEMLDQVKKEYTADELAMIDNSYKVFGLIPRPLSTGDLMAKLLTEEVGGFYDPDNKRMVLILEKGSDKDPGFLGRLLGAKKAFDKEEQKTVLAHEMTHALQDQLYDLNAMQKLIEKDDDMSLAFSALVEGDATLLMFAETGEQDVTKMDVDAMRSTFQLMTWMMPVAGGKTYRSAPAIFRDSLIFPYLQGMLFNLSLANRQGWPGVHAAYADPPTSTEQILHPKKYFSRTERDDPRSVSIPSLTEFVGDNWKHLGGNCLGEFQTAILLRSERSSKRASEGWDGDWYEVFYRPDETLGLVWVSVWDSETDAAEFADTYRQYRTPAALKKKTKQNSDKESPASDPDITDPTKPWPFSEDSVRYIEAEGDRVHIIEGFDQAATDRIIAALKNVTISDKRFPPASKPEPSK